MPKIIEDAKEKIVQAARTQLLSQGYAKMSIRGVAKACGVATGTVYNYYPGKELLAANVILEDWLRSLEQMRARCAAAGSIRDGLFAVYDDLTQFQAFYSEIWSEYALVGKSRQVYRDRHRLLVGQLAAILSELLARFRVEPVPGLPVFLAENLLTASSEPYPFEPFAAIVGRIFQSITTMKEE